MNDDRRQRKEEKEQGKGGDKERRLGDRRESPRVPMRFLVRDIAGGGTYEERDGDLSLGGIYWKGSSPPMGKDVDIRFRLPGVPVEIRAKGEIIRLTNRGGGIDFHLRFTRLDVQDELTIARYVETHTGHRK